MANCRIQNLTPACGYNGSGIIKVILLDFEDFQGFGFQDGAGYESCFVESMFHSGDFVEIPLLDFPGDYAGNLNAGIYSHVLEAFLSELSGSMLSQLHLATKRPQLVIFETRAGKYFVFGQDNGAKASFNIVTADGTGAVLTLSATSIYPLFEVSADALQPYKAQPGVYVPVFDETAVCEIDAETDTFTGFLQATFAARVSGISGEPLDIKGVLTSQSGNNPAAMVLEGFPDPLGYEVTGTFARRAYIDGAPSVQYAPDICEAPTPAGWILDTGFWNNSAYWLDNGIWNY
jgi:hypothetical protein